MTDNIKLRFEVTDEGKKKTKMIAHIPEANGRQLAAWGGKTVRYAQMMVSGHGIIKRQSGHLSRNIGMEEKRITDKYQVTVGTGVGWQKKSVKYAEILDSGGTIYAKRRNYFYRNGKRYQFKNGPYLYIPIYGGGMRHVGEPKSFRLKKSVRIPPFGWWKKTIRKMRPELDRMLDKKEVLKKARSM